MRHKEPPGRYESYRRVGWNRLGARILRVDEAKSKNDLAAQSSAQSLVALCYECWYLNASFSKVRVPIAEFLRRPYFALKTRNTGCNCHD